MLTIGVGVGVGFEATSGGGVSAPTNSVAPVISGNVQVGQTLSTTDGTWTGSPTFTYQWKRGGVNIGSATANTYVLVEDDAGQAITCAVTGTNGAGNASATSNTLTIDVYLVFLAHIEDPTDLTTYSGGVWNTASLGTAASNRKIILGIAARINGAARTISSASVAGTALASKAAISSETGFNVAELWVADIAAGTTGDVIITFSGGMQRCGGSLWALYGAGSSTASDTKSSTADPSGTLALSVPAKGVGVGLSLGIQGTSTTWTGLTERFDIAVEGTVCHSGADINSNAGGTINTTSDWSGVQTSAPCHILASWGP